MQSRVDLEDMSQKVYDAIRLIGLSGNKWAANAKTEVVKVLTAAAGTWHSLAVAETGSLYSWGRCQYGQLGYNCEKSASSVAFPRKVELPRKVAKVVAGAAHSFALTFTS